MINLGEDYDKVQAKNAGEAGSGESAKPASSSLKVKENAAAAQIDDGDIGKSYEEKVQVRREHFSNWLIDEFTKWRDKIGGANTLLFSALIIRGVSCGEYFDLVQKTYKESTSRAGDFLRTNLGTLKGYNYEPEEMFDECEKDRAVRACTEYCVKYLPSEIPYDNASNLSRTGGEMSSADGNSHNSAEKHIFHGPCKKRTLSRIFQIPKCAWARQRL